MPRGDGVDAEAGQFEAPDDVDLRVARGGARREGAGLPREVRDGAGQLPLAALVEDGDRVRGEIDEVGGDGLGEAPVEHLDHPVAGLLRPFDGVVDPAAAGERQLGGAEAGEHLGEPVGAADGGDEDDALH